MGGANGDTITSLGGANGDAITYHWVELVGGANGDVITPHCGAGTSSEVIG